MPCCVCAVVAVESLEAPERGVVLCRACAHRIGRLLERSTDAFVCSLWSQRPPSRATDSPEEHTFARFKEQLDESLERRDAAAHVDLAAAFAEMGLGLDAIRHAAIALDRETPSRVAQKAFTLIFGQHSRPSALDDVLAALRSTN